MSSETIFHRDYFIKKLAAQPAWDVIIIGGGATGLGIAVDSASRGYKTLLLEGADFAKGTSSRSTKLVHGGVRYLAQGSIRLVYDALRERGLLLKNAAHLVKRQSFIIPCYSWLEKIKYLVGLKLYDLLSGRLSFGRSTVLSPKNVIDRFPAINTQGLAGGIEYFDGQFDDARLAINLAQTAAEQGAILLNYCNVKSLVKETNAVKGVRAVDAETGKEYNLLAKTVINATGVFVDDVLQMDRPGTENLVRPSQGIHLVVDKKFLGGKGAIMIPKTADGRVLFAIPWHNTVLLGTTDTPLSQHSTEPVAQEAEIAFVLETFGQYMHPAPGRKDVQSVFAGLRPLAATNKSSSTKELSRDHKLFVSASGLLTITGGKWTTYRKMAEATIDLAIKSGSLEPKPCRTESIRIHGSPVSSSAGETSLYGTDQQYILELINAKPSLSNKLVDGYPYTEAEVVWAVKAEMARTVEDVLARRLRLLFLDVVAAVKAAPRVAELLAAELGYTRTWEAAQVETFQKLAATYTIKQQDNKHYETIAEVSNLTH